MKKQKPSKPISENDIDVRGYQGGKIDQIFLIENEEDLNNFTAKTVHSKKWYNYFYQQMIHDKELDFKKLFENLFQSDAGFRSENVRIVYVIGFEDVYQEAPLHDFRGSYSVHEVFIIESSGGDKRKIFTKCIKYKEC